MQKLTNFVMAHQDRGTTSPYTETKLAEDEIQ